MRSRSVTGLALVTLVVLAAVLWSLHQYRQRTAERLVDQSPFADLAAQADRIDRIVISSGERQVHLRRLPTDKGATSGEWGVVERADYPADRQMLVKLLRELGELRLLEKRTDRPELFARLHLDPKASPPPLDIRLQDDQGGALVHLLVGKRRQSAGGGAAQYFVRQGESSQTYLAEKVPTPSPNPPAWLAKKAVDIAAEQIRRVRIERDGEQIVISREQPGGPLQLEGVPEGREVNQGLLKAATFGLRGLPVNDVYLADQAPAAFDSPRRTRFETFDGLLVDLVAQPHGEKFLVKVSASVAPGDAPPQADAAAAQGTGGDPRGQAARINARLGNRVLLVPAHAVATFTRTREALLLPLPKEGAAQGP